MVLATSVFLVLILVCSFSLLSLFLLVYSYIVFLLFLVCFAVARSSVCIFILFNDYFVCCKEIVCTGVKQGCMLSPTFFILYLSDVSE